MVNASVRRARRKTGLDTGRLKRTAWRKARRAARQALAQGQEPEVRTLLDSRDLY